jgi:hypothetical protein
LWVPISSRSRLTVPKTIFDAGFKKYHSNLISKGFCFGTLYDEESDWLLILIGN